jgi:hypothetical protein
LSATSLADPTLPITPEIYISTLIQPFSYKSDPPIGTYLVSYAWDMTGVEEEFIHLFSVQDASNSMGPTLRSTVIDLPDIENTTDPLPDAAQPKDNYAFIETLDRKC